MVNTELCCLPNGLRPIVCPCSDRGTCCLTLAIRGNRWVIKSLVMYKFVFCIIGEHLLGYFLDVLPVRFVFN